MTASIEIFIRCLGNPGYYQLLVFILLACNFFPISFNTFVITFYTAEPEFYCKMPQGWAWHSNASIPIITANGVSKFDNCHMYKDPENHALGNKNCIYGYNYKLTPPEWPIVAEWNLVCNNKYLVTVATLLYYGGCLFGALVCGPLAEKYGRRNIMLCCLMCQLIIGFSTFFVKQFVLFVALRTVQGMFIQALECVSIVLAMELFPPKYRTMAGSACFLVYAFAMMFLSLLSYCIQHWQYIQLAISLPSIIAISYFWLIPESIRYLMISTKLEEIASVLKTYTWFMPTSIPTNANTNAKAACKYIKIDPHLSYDVRDLMKSAILRRHTLFHSFCWLSAYLMYCSLTFFIPDLNSNKYLNFFLVGLVEFASHFIAFFAFHKFGRRRPLFILFICSGILSITSVLVDHLAKSRLSTLKVSISLAVIGKICITACISGLYIFSAETFPTIIRTIGIGVCAAAKISGALLAPLIQLLGNQTLRAIPVILVGAAALVAAFVVLMLPETHTRSLPDLIAECDEFSKQKSISPMVDKRSSTSGKVTLYDHPLTPPIKRAALSKAADREECDDEKNVIQSNDESETVKIDMEITKEIEEGNIKNEIQVEEIKDEEKVCVNNRCVRFLGIEVLDNGCVQKKISISSDERRVRFANVVHDIDEIETISNNNNNNNKNNNLESNIINEKKSSESSLEDSTNAPEIIVVNPINEQNINAVKPAFSILKKTSQEESDKKIIRSPYPTRKVLTEDKEGISNVIDNNEVINETVENESETCIESKPNTSLEPIERMEIENKETMIRHKDSVYELKCVMKSV